MKYFLLIFLFIPVLLNADNPRLPGGQESETDSLEQLLQNRQGLDRYDPLMQLTKQYLYREPEKAFRYAIEAATIAGDEGKLPELYEAKEYVGISKIISGKFDTALIIFSQLLQNYTDLGDEARVGKIHNMLGITRQNMEEHDQALDHYFASLKINEKMNNRMGMANNFNNIGSMYYELGNYPQALIYFKKALAVYEEKNSDGSMLGTVGDISKPVGNISMIYKATEKYDSALIFAEKALVLNREAGNDYGVVGTLNNIGYIYDGMKKYAEAINAYKQSLEINKKVNDRWSIANTNTNIAFSYIKLGQYDVAGPYLERAMAVAREINAKDLMIFTFETYSKLFKGKGNYQKALEYYRLMAGLKDSIFTEKKASQIAELEIKYETEKKDKENLVLKKDNEFKQLKITKDKTIINSMIAGIVSAVILLVIIFYLYRKRSIAYKNLVTKNLELAHCDRKILNEGEFLPSLPHGISGASESNNEQMEKELELIRQFNKYMAEEKPYLYSNFSIERVSAQIGTNRTYLSQAINTIYDKSFLTLVNEFRIRAARQMLTDGKYLHISLEGIGKMAGYNSRTSFINNFKKITGLTPSYFRDSISVKKQILIS